MCTIDKVTSDILGNTVNVTFLNDKSNTFQLSITDRNVPLDCVSNQVNYNTWINFLNDEFETLLINQNKCVIVGNKLTVTYNEMSRPIFFDLDSVLSITNEVMDKLVRIFNKPVIDVYDMEYKKGNIVVTIDGYKETIVSNISKVTHHYKLGYLPYSKDRDLERMCEGLYMLVFSLKTKPIQCVFFRDCKYYFTEAGLIRYIFRENDSIREVLSKINTDCLVDIR